MKEFSFHKNNIKQNEANWKVEKRQDISVSWKVSERVSDLHTNKNNFQHNLKQFDFPFVFRILYILMA